MCLYFVTFCGKIEAHHEGILRLFLVRKADENRPAVCLPFAEFCDKIEVHLETIFERMYVAKSASPMAYILQRFAPKLRLFYPFKGKRIPLKVIFTSLLLFLA